MSSSDEEVKEVPLPKHRIRFTDLPVKSQDKAIRCKLETPIPFPRGKVNRDSEIEINYS